MNYSQRIKRLLKFDHKIAFDSHKQKLHYLNSVKRCMYSSKQYKIYQPKKIFHFSEHLKLYYNTRSV